MGSWMEQPDRHLLCIKTNSGQGVWRERTQTRGRRVREDFPETVTPEVDFKGDSGLPHGAAGGRQSGRPGTRGAQKENSASFPEWGRIWTLKGENKPGQLRKDLFKSLDYLQKTVRLYCLITI